MSGLQSHQGATLLDVVDKLRSFGTIRQDLSLPQIVVVGQQSSGKSSVLEAISGISFPAKDGQCTRFATEVVLRRGQSIKRSISIHTLDKSEDKTSRIQRFESRWNEFQLEKLPDIIEDAKTIMTFAEESQFSEDILRVEVSGPDQDHLTLIDLPGLFISTRKGQKPGDRKLVDDLATKYMDKPRTIVLAVVSGKTDLENQNVFNKLSTVDRDQNRTLGVITAPDAIERGSPNEATFQALANNRDTPLKLGWHVMRNPSLAEKQAGADRKKLEDETFKLKPWSDLPSEHRGVASLKKRLNHLLMQHISQELEGILTDVQTAIDKLKLDIPKLGEERSTPKQQQIHLLNIAKDFKRLTGCALAGEYRDDFLQNNPENCLRAAVYNANLLYADIMCRFGHRWDITDRMFAADIMIKPEKWSHISDPKLITKENLSKKVQAMHQDSRGLELPGTFQPALVGKLFRKQAKKWQNLTNHHIQDVFKIVKDFFEVLLPHIAGEENAQSLLIHIIDPALEKRKNTLQAKAEEVLRPYLQGHPITLNGIFVKLLAKRNDRKSENLVDDDSSSTDSDIQHSAQMKQSYEVIHQMEAYYEIALGVLVDNIAILAIEQCLLDGLDDLISPQTVIQESDERLSLLAAESEESASLRQRLKQQLQDYEDGKTALLPHVSRSRNSAPNHVAGTAQQHETDPHRVKDIARSRSQPPPTTQTNTQPAGATALSASSANLFAGFGTLSTPSQNVPSSNVTTTTSKPFFGQGQSASGQGSRLFDLPSSGSLFGQSPSTTSASKTTSSTNTFGGPSGGSLFSSSGSLFSQSPSTTSASKTTSSTNTFGGSSGAVQQPSQLRLNADVTEVSQFRAYQSVPTIEISNNTLILKRIPQLSGYSLIREKDPYGRVSLYRLATQSCSSTTGMSKESFEEIRLRDWKVIHGRSARRWIGFTETKGSQGSSGKLILAWRDYTAMFDSIYQKQNMQEESS